jgi:hypothetical protein
MPAQSRVVFRNAGFDLAHHVAADVCTLGEDAAAETREYRNQRSAEGKCHERINHGARCWLHAHRSCEETEIENHTEEAEARHEKSGDCTRLERKVKPAGQRLGSGLRHAHVGAHRHVHADEACSA